MLVLLASVVSPKSTAFPAVVIRKVSILLVILGLRPLARTDLVGEEQCAPQDLPAVKSPKSCELPKVAIVMNCMLLK